MVEKEPELQGLNMNSESKGVDSDLVKDVQLLLRETKLGDSAYYWLGLSARADRFDGQDLKEVYDKVTEKMGQPAADSFATMIIDMPSLAPAKVVIATFSLAGNRWEYDPELSEKLQKRGIDVESEVPREGGKRDEHFAREMFNYLIQQTPEKGDETDVVKGVFMNELGDDLDRIIASQNSKK